MKECGGVFAMRIYMAGDWVFLCSPEAIREAYKASPVDLTSGRLLGEMIGSMFGQDSLAFMDGDDHKRRQRLVVPLLSGESVLSYVDEMRKTSEDEISRWAYEEQFPLVPRIHRLSLEIMLRAMFYDQNTERTNRLVDAYNKFTEEAVQSPLLALPWFQWNLGSWSPWGRLLRLRETTRNIFRDEIIGRMSKYRQGQRNKDLFSALIESEHDGVKLKEAALFDEIFLLLFAGHETTSTSLAWIIERVLSHPNVVEEIVEELDAVLGDKPVEREDLSHLKYLGAVIDEGMRVARRAPFTGLRRVNRQLIIGDYTFRKGQVFAICHHAMCHREDLFPRPDLFDPGRFLRKEHLGTGYSPFGRADRACAGRYFAQIELKVVMATIFQRLQITLVAPVKKPVRLGLLFAPDNGLRVTIKPRNKGPR